jgi:hypothetical protein
LVHLACGWVNDHEYPVVAWCCDAVTPQVDIERFFEDFEETLEIREGVEIDDVTTDLDGLKEALRAWNAKQTATLWMPSTTRCVLIERSDVFGDEVEP